MQVRRLLLAVAVAIASLAVISASAQAQGPNTAPGAHAIKQVVKPAKTVKPKVYTECEGGLGCFGPFDIYAKTKQWSFPDEGISGTYSTEKVGRKTYTIFVGTGEFGEVCEAIAVKNKTGYSSEAEPGLIACAFEGTIYHEDSFWAIKG